ncbi:MAG TPA: hypothetical protein VK171_06905, partial [Fimbriimonas sp.]|nr:hypothetical protein [Fimbriimonas sp.]
MKLGASNLNLLALALVASSILVACNGTDPGAGNAEPSTTGGSTPTTSAGGRKAPAAEGFAVEGDTIKIGVFEPTTGENGGGGMQEVLGARFANT